MIQLAVRFRQNEDVPKFVDIVEKLPYHADLTSGKRVVDAKSLLGVFALSKASRLKLSIYANYADIDPSHLNCLAEFSGKKSESDRQEIA